LGSVVVGGGAPVSVQSMTKTDTRDAAATIRQLRRLEAAGCDIVRVAVPDAEAAAALGKIKKASRVPIVADIHFDYRLALSALEAGVDGLRLNPGNLRDPAHVRKVVSAARERSVPIRIGVNAGSLPRDYRPGLPLPERMVQLAHEQARQLEALDFGLIKISLKAFDVPSTVKAYELMAERADYPLHLGITESGLPGTGVVRSAVGLGILLGEGIGDTLRVSLTAPPEQEVKAGLGILGSLNLRVAGPVLVSCPACGRAGADVASLARRVEKLLTRVELPIRVAVMGCEVNGPGEARDADAGVACGKGRCAIFRRGRIVRTVPQGEALEALSAEIERLVAGKRNRKD
jgi:(E)-4-hydroxy-3-methylbut-2-enyl-diphosphate synthase